MRSRRPPSSQEGFFQLAKLLVEQVVGLVDQADEDVGDHFGLGAFRYRSHRTHRTYFLCCPGAARIALPGCPYPRGLASAPAENPGNLPAVPPSWRGPHSLALSQLPSKFPRPGSLRGYSASPIALPAPSDRRSGPAFRESVRKSAPCRHRRFSPSGKKAGLRNRHAAE